MRPGTSIADRRHGSATEPAPDPDVRVDPGAWDVIGTLQLTFVPSLTFRGGWRGQVEAVRVATARRGQGLGRVLVGWAIETARARGCHVVQLTTNRDRLAAHRFYEGLGFTPSHLGMKLYLDGDVGGRAAT